MIEYSSYNHKIKREARCMIFNMQPADKCIARRLGLCQLNDPDRCYARKGEVLYPFCLPFRQRQARYWRLTPAVKIAEDIIKEQERKRIKFKHLRLNESGDFRSLRDIVKASRVADLISTVGIETYTYTARIDLFPYEHSTHLVINGSGFMVDNCFEVVDRHYKAVKGDIMCKGDCSHCHICKRKRGVIIKAKEH